MKTLRLVGWSHDRVIAADFATSVLAKFMRGDPAVYIRMFTNNSWFGPGDVECWEKEKGIKVDSVGVLADMLTDFFYYNVRTTEQSSLLKKIQLIFAKNYILRDMTVAEVWDVAENHIPFTKGAEEAIRRFKQEGLYQTIFSDTLGLVIERVLRKYGMNAGGGVPAKLELVDQADLRVVRSDVVEGMEERVLRTAKLTGHVLPYDKWKSFFEYIKTVGMGLGEVIVVDDSAANIAPMKQIQDAGGLAIGFNPTEAHLPRFVDAGIPVLRQREPDMGPFVEIVLAEPEERGNVINRYCAVK